MKPVFLDASGLIAKVNTRDNWHTVANAIWKDLIDADTPLVTTSLVLVELGDGLSRLRHRHLAIEIRRRLLLSSRVTVVPIAAADEEQAWLLYEQRADKEWGVTDCVSINAMTRLGIDRVYSADRHFEQAGFSILLTSS